MTSSLSSPIKKVTIPKLELRGAVLGLRTSKVVSQALAIPVAEHVFWTDSLNVVYWVRSHAKNFTSDVACRVSEIQADTKASQCRHVPGVLNPADFPSRGMKVLDLVGRHTWWSGPDFLTRPETEWPLVELATPPQLPGELKKKPCMTFASQVTPSRLDPATYSTWERLTRVTAWCLRFVQNARRQTATVTRGETHVDTANTSVPLVYVRLPSGHKPRSVVTVPVLTAAEVAGAERHWFAQAQLSAYPATLKRLRAGEELPPSDPLYRLNAVLDATSHPALMVVNGRLKHAVNLPVAGPALDIQHSPVRVYLAHAGQPGQAGSDHPAEKQPKSLLKTQQNRKAYLSPEIGHFIENKANYQSPQTY